MQNSSVGDSSIADEYYDHLEPKKTVKSDNSREPNILRYATINDIKNLERLAEFQNNRFLQDKNNILKNKPFFQRAIHFIWKDFEEHLISKDKDQKVSGVMIVQNDKMMVNIPLSNYETHNWMKMEILGLKRGKTLNLQTLLFQDHQRQVKFKFLISLVEKTVLLRILVEVEKQFKVWKQMSVPLDDNKVILQIEQFNNGDTQIKINDYKFHLVIKLPIIFQSIYAYNFDCADVIRIEIKSQSNDLNEAENPQCSHECALI